MPKSERLSKQTKSAVKKALRGESVPGLTSPNWRYSYRTPEWIAFPVRAELRRAGFGKILSRI